MSSPYNSDTYPLPVSVAFSGPDNTGKTKQIGILARRMGPAASSAGPLDRYDPRWNVIKADGMARWWFETGPVEEVADVLATSYLERSRLPFSAPVRLLDRGIPMLEASVAATVAVREDLDAAQATDRARILLAPYETDLRAAEEDEHALVLLHCEDPEEGARRSLAHEVSVTDIYAAYQRHLHEQINRLVDEGRFPMAIRIGDRPTVAVQDEVRRLLAPLHPEVPGRALAGVHVTALGGMSESGKSTAGEYLRTQHGHARLKIGYLIENSASHAGIGDPYRLGPVVQAELIVTRWTASTRPTTSSTPSASSRCTTSTRPPNSPGCSGPSSPSRTWTPPRPHASGEVLLAPRTSSTATSPNAHEARTRSSRSPMRSSATTDRAWSWSGGWTASRSIAAGRNTSPRPCRSTRSDSP
ncbi:hypothetical protein [Streptomyces sp. NPDC059142]|uniref:hypothetical protein n=1 Tax=Streptomyces sp. NPDC059142 TaxID=3346739 RepID=UPI003682CA8C